MPSKCSVMFVQIRNPITHVLMSLGKVLAEYKEEAEERAVIRAEGAPDGRQDLGGSAEGMLDGGMVGI